MPFTTFFIVIATIASQIFYLLASVLPIKVILMIASGSVPRFFPDFMRQIQMNELIAYLGGAALLSYVGHLLLQHGISLLTGRGAELIQERSEKFEIFNNQSAIVQQAYNAISEVLAGLAFYLVVCAAIFSLYFELFLFVQALWLILFLVVFLDGLRVREGSAWFEGGVDGKLYSICASLAFLFCFVFVVNDYLEPPAPVFLSAIISVIMLRQSLNRFAMVANNFQSLIAQKDRVNALFFHGVAYDQGSGASNRGWLELSRGVRESVVYELLAKSHPDTTEFNPWFMLPTLSKGVYSYQLKPINSKLGGRYIVNVFNSGREKIAKNEVNFFNSSDAKSLLSHLSFLGEVQLRGVQIHLYETAERIEKADASAAAGLARGFQYQLAMKQPSQNLIEVWGRSHVMFIKQFDQKYVERFERAFVGTRWEKEASFYSRCIPVVGAKLLNYPLQLHIPMPKNDELRVTLSGTLFLYRWDSWSIVPLGSSLPKKLVNNDSELSDFVGELKASREDCAKLTPRLLRLAVEASDFIDHMAREKYHKALESLVEVSKIIKSPG